MKRRPIRTGILLVVTALVWFLAVKVNFPGEETPASPGVGRHLPHIDVGPGTHVVTDPEFGYTFAVPTGFAVEPRTGDLIPESWLPTGARITREGTEAAVDTDALSDAELASSTEANPEGPTPAVRGVVETFTVQDFRVVVADWQPALGIDARTYTAYHGRTVVTFTMIPPDPVIDTYDPTVFPAAVDAVLRSLGFA